MATPTYGGTNSVTVLDIGQPGGTLETAGTARAVLRAFQVNSDMIQTVTRIPQQGPAFHDIQGPGHPMYRWEGTVKVAATTDMLTIMSNLERALTGHPLDADGSYGAFDADEIRATALKDSHDNFHATKSRILRYSLGRWLRITSGGSYNYVSNVTIDFQRLN